jgi:hypothetical protein
MAQKPAPKHLTITIDFDLQTEGSTVQYQRARAAYEAAVQAAIREAKKVLPPDSIRAITSEIDWSYRWQREHEVRFTGSNGKVFHAENRARPMELVVAQAPLTEAVEEVADNEEEHWDEHPGVVWDPECCQWLPLRMTEGSDVEIGAFDGDDTVA